MKPSLRREHGNGDLQVEEEPAKESPRKGVPGRKKRKGKVPEAGKGWAWWRNRNEVSSSVVQGGGETCGNGLESR